MLKPKQTALLLTLSLITTSPTLACQGKDIVDTAVGAGSFQTLVTAVQKAGLVETLKGTGPFTVFAPSDEAFAKLPSETLDNLLKDKNKDQLIALLTYHVVPGRLTASDIIQRDSVDTVQGSTARITVDGSTVMIDNATVTAADIECSNGVIHVIDSVILPPANAGGH